MLEESLSRLTNKLRTGVLAPNAKLRAQVVAQVGEAAQEPKAKEPEADQGQQRDQGRPLRLGWARLLKRVLNLDLEHCPKCGGELRIAAMIFTSPPQL